MLEEIIIIFKTTLQSLHLIVEKYFEIDFPVGVHHYKAIGIVQAYTSSLSSIKVPFTKAFKTLCSRFRVFKSVMR